MDSQTLAWIVLGIALFGFGIYRQFVRRPVETTRLLLVPLGIAAWGLVQLANAPLDAAALAWLALDLALAIALGAWRARTMRVWRASEGVAMSQGSTMTAIGWGASIAVRVLFGVAGGVLGIAPNVGGILLAVAATFGAQNALLVWRARNAVVTPAPTAA